MATPRTLEDWTIAEIENLLEKGMLESDTFDFKEMLPHSRDDNAKIRLRKTCCAFANSEGGFIVFGVCDDTSKSPQDRIVGIDPSLDFPQQFGNFARTCTPSGEWDFLNPPMDLSSGNKIHVVEVRKSWRAPRAVGDRDTGWQFVRRSNQGNEGMSMEEVRAMFLGFYEKRLKLQLLRAEIATLRDTAVSSCVTDEAEIGQNYSLESFDTRLIDSIISDTYSITAADAELIEALSRIRQVVRVANNKIQIFFGIVQVPMTNKNALVREHNEFMLAKRDVLLPLCDLAMDRLDQILAP